LLLVKVIATGEAVTSALVKKFASQKLLYNAYGPAEVSDMVSSCDSASNHDHDHSALFSPHSDA
jgi:hypothetical protein